MSVTRRFPLAHILQTAAILVMAAMAFIASLATILAVFGILPWIEFSAQVGGATLPWAGAALQIGLTGILIALLGLAPMALRVSRLEATHRAFNLDIHDIARAYRAAHEADRAEMFNMASQHDAVLERMDYLNSLPRLEKIDEDLLRVASQMSAQSSDLAANFSDERLRRTRAALKQRLADARILQDRVQSAFATMREIRRLTSETDFEEAAAAAQLERLQQEMAVINGLKPLPPSGPGNPRKKASVTYLRSV